MNFFCKFLLVLTVAGVGFSKDEDIPDPDVAEQIRNCFPPDNATQTGKIPVGITEKQNELALKLLKQIYSTKNGSENVFYSPYSVYHSLLLTLFISNGNTETGLRSFLNFPPELSKAKIVEAFKVEGEAEKLTVLENIHNLILGSGSKLFVRSDLEVRDCLKSLFESELYPLDFLNDPKGAADTINRFILDRSNYQIRNFVQSSDFGQDVKLFLADGIFFKTKWANEFPPQNTKEKTFRAFGGNFPVAMMEKTDVLNYGVCDMLKSEILQLPFVAKNLSMYLVLPSSPDESSMDDLVSKINVHCLHEYTSGNMLKKTDVSVQLPKFTVEKSLQLTEHLKNLGVGDLFDSTADLSGLTGNKEVFINIATHKAKIIVEEPGAISFASSVFRFKRSTPDTVNFVCDRPFLYFIFDHDASSVLFIGVYNQP